MRPDAQPIAMIPWLRREAPFPPIEAALDEPNGLLAAGGELTPERLLEAYSRGIFPWYSDGQPVLWWSPDPRTVLFVDEFTVPRSLRKVVAQQRFDIRVDTAFRDVIERCAEPRSRVTLIPSRPGKRTGWSAACTGSPWAACSLANRCSPAKATLRRWRWSIWWRSFDAWTCPS